MLFSRASKAGPVAVILIILTAISRLIAAPIIPLDDLVQELTQEARARPADSELGLGPQRFRISETSAFRRVWPGRHWQGNVNGEDPDGPVSHVQSTRVRPLPAPNSQGWGQHTGYGGRIVDSGHSGHGQYPDASIEGQYTSRRNPRFEASIGTSARNEDHRASTSGGSGVSTSLHGSTRMTAFPGTGVAGEPWSDADILEILRGKDWRALDRAKKSGFLNSFGKMALTWSNYKDSVFGQNRWKDFHDLALKLVEEYLKVRLDDRAEREAKGRLRFNWLVAAPRSDGFFNHARGHLQPIKDHQWVTESAADQHPSDPFGAFHLGDFDVRVVGEGRGTGGRIDWASGLAEKPRTFNVVAIAAPKTRMIYVGKVEISLAR